MEVSALLACIQRTVLRGAPETRAPHQTGGAGEVVAEEFWRVAQAERAVWAGRPLPLIRAVEAVEGVGSPPVALVAPATSRSQFSRQEGRIAVV